MNYRNRLYKGFCLLLFSVVVQRQLSAQSTACAPLQANAVINCANQTAQLSCDTSYTSYSWSPSAGLSNSTISNPVATLAGIYTVTANYQGPNIVVNPYFAAGNTGFTSGMNFSTFYTPCNYWVGTQWFQTYFPGLTDHTPTADNMFMMIDGCTTPTIIWEENNFAVVPGGDYQFSFWATQAGANQPIYEIHFIGNVTGDNIISTQNGIPAPGNGWVWDQYGIPSWNAGPNTTVSIRIINLATQGYGVDFGMDDFDFHRFCSATDSVQVSFNPASVNLGPDVYSCNVTTLVLDAGAGGSYLWNTGDTTQTISPTGPGSYWVIYDNGFCTATDTVGVYALNATVDIGPDTAMCDVSGYVLDAGPGGTYLWSTGATTQTIVPGVPGVYWVNFDNGQCVTSDTVVISALPIPVVSLGADTNVCGATQLTLDAGQGGNYAWSTGDTTQTIAGGPGTYWVNVSNGFCSGEDTIVIGSLALPIVNLGPDITTCDINTVLLNAGSGGSYLWNTGATTQTISPVGPGIFWVDVDNGQCVAHDTILVTVLQTPVVDLGADTFVCNGNQLTLDAGPGGNYLWNTGDTTQTIVATSGFYWVTYSNGACTSEDTILVAALPQPVVNLGPDISLCDVSTVTLDAGAGGSYLWNTGATTQTLSPGVPGIYWVTYSDGFCIDSDTVIVSSLNIEPVSLGDDILLCDYDYVELDAGPGNSYLWSTGETTQTISPGYAGTYYVTVGSGSCTSSDTIELEGTLGESVLYIPNTVTPDGNGLNDVFYVYSTDIMEFRMRIFDRWGELIYESTDINAGWDATYKGNIVQQDTYVYVIDYSTTCNGTTQKKTGNVNVIR